MATKIKPLRKFTTGVPSTSDMEVGELAVNTADKKIYMRDNTSGASSIVEVANASGSAADDITTGNAAVNIATTTGNITIDAQGSDTDIIFKGKDNTTDITALTLDMSEGGFADFRQGAQFRNSVLFSTDGVQLKFGTNNEIGIQHVHNVGLLLTETGGGQPTLQFVDSNESVSSDGTNLILTSGGNSITVPNTAGTVALTSQIPTVPTNASIHLKPHFVKVSNEDSDAGGIKYIKVATIDSSSPSTSNSTFVFRILLEGRSAVDGASQFRVHIRTGDSAANSSVVVEQEHSNRHTYYGIDSFIFLWNSQNNSEFWVKLPNNGSTSYQQLFAKLEVSASEDTEYISGHDDVTIHTGQAWQNFAPSGTNQITAEWIKKRFDSIIFEGSTTNTSETFLQAADPTADRTITLPDASGTVLINSGDQTLTGDLSFPDNEKAIFGTGGDLEIYHTGSNADIRAVTGNVEIRALEDDHDIYLITDNGSGGLTNYVHCDGGTGEVKLGHYGSQKLATKSTGVDITGTISSNATINEYGSTSAPIVFAVTVATQTTAHPYYNDGSTNKYSIDGIQGAALTLHGADNVTSNSQYVYRFDQSDSTNNGHPLRFYLDAAKGYAYTTGVTTNGTPGQAGAYTQIAVTQDTPQILYYQCSQHGYMGNYVIIPHSTNIKQNQGSITFDAIGGNIALTGNTGEMTFTNTGSNADIVFATNGTGKVKLNHGGAGEATVLTENTSIGDLSDVFTTGISDGEILKWNNSNGRFEPSADATGGGSASDSFKTIAVSGQSDVVADSSTDTLTLVAGSNMSITTNASGDSITFASSGGGGTASDSFKTISVSGQSDVVADSSTDTLTLVAGNNMTITTNASGDEISFAASGGAGSGISEEQAIAFAIVYG